MSRKRRGADRPFKLPNDGRKVGLIIGLLVVACLIPLGIFSVDDDTTVPAPASTQSTDTVEILRKAAEAHGICYGWRLADRSNVISIGSNLGDGAAVDEDASCSRWVQISATVVYTSRQSEIEDYASFLVRSSADVTSTGFEAGLRRLGIDEAVFVDDPGWAITRAAVFLSLLMVEQGAAPPVPVATDEPAAVPSPLPSPGSDVWRDRWGYLLAGGAMLLVTAILATVGWAQRQRELQQAAAAPPKRSTTRSSSRGTAGRKSPPKATAQTATPRKTTPRKATAQTATPRKTTPRKATAQTATPRKTTPRKATPRKGTER